MNEAKYKRALDSVFAPEDTETRVLSALSHGSKAAIRKTALILCAALILTCGAALATGTAGQWLEAMISLNGREIPEGNLQKIGRTVEGDGLRVTLDSVASDGVHTYFLMNVEALSGQDLSNTDPQSIPMEDSLYPEVNLDLPSSGGYSFRPLRIDDGSDPARARIILKFDFGVPRNGSRIYLTVESLSRGLWTTGENGKQLYEHDLIAEGEWTFSVRLNGNLDGVHYRIPDYDFDISISPLGIAINGVGSRIFGSEAYLLMEDGSKVKLTGYGISAGARNHVTYRELVSYEFTGLIDADRAAALVYAGNEYPLIRVP